MLLVCSIVAVGQIKPIKKPNTSKPKTENTEKPKQSHSSNNDNKVKKTSKTGSQQSSHSSISNHLGSTSTNRSIPAVVKRVLEDMVWVEGSSFTTRTSTRQRRLAGSNENPVKSYYISRYEVTQELWETVMGNNPSDFTGDALRPVEQVSWTDCQTFISRLNKLTGKHFRLPTEAEWEFAARGGNKSLGYVYAGSDIIDGVAWYTDNSGRTTHPVGQKSPNELGLYDMSGNVWEWCSDWYGSYNSRTQTDNTSSDSGRVYRGGGCVTESRYCRVSYQNGGDLMLKGSDLGLRLAMSSNK